MVSIRRWLVGAAAAATLLLAGCATPMRGQLTAFHEWPADAPRTYRFVRSEAQRESLEHATWERLLRAELARAGFREAASPRFAIGFDYRVTRQLSRVVDAYPGGFHPYFWWGAWGPHGGVSLGGPFPWWGPGWYPVERDRVWYAYRLRIEIEDLAARPPRRVYEGTAVSDGLDPAPADVLPLLARAVLGDFPGPSGVTRRVEVPTEPAR